MYNEQRHSFPEILKIHTPEVMQYSVVYASGQGLWSGHSWCLGLLCIKIKQS